MIVLAPFTEADFPQLVAWIDSERLLREWCGARYTFPLTAAQLRRSVPTANPPAALVYKALDAHTRAVGHIALDHLNWDEQSGRITRVLVGRAADRGRGYGQAMVNAVLAIGFKELQLRRIGLGVCDFNHAAIHCYQRCGFRHIGTLRHVARYDGAYWSSVEMSLAKEAWQPVPLLAQLA
jgi:RimJ/RimL family protein N-acetyltransferase